MSRRQNVNVTLMLGSQGAQQARADVQTITQESEALNQSLENIRDIAVVALGFEAARRGARQIRRMVDEGIEWNKTLQETRDSMTAMIAAGDPVFRGDLERSFAAAGVHMRELEAQVDRTGGSLDELFTLFSETAPMAAGAGIAMQDYATLTADAAQASNALGIETGRVTRELQAILAGRVSQRGILSQVLELTTEEVGLASEQGRLYELLSDRLQDYLVDVEGVGAESERLRNTWRQLIGTLAEPIFDQLEESARELREMLGEEELQGEVAALGEALGRLFDMVRGGARFLIDYRRVVIGVTTALSSLVVAATVWRGLMVAKNLLLRRQNAALVTNSALMRAHPIGLLAAGLGAAAAFLPEIVRGFGGTASGIREANREAAEFEERIKAIAGESERVRLAEDLEAELDGAFGSLERLGGRLRNVRRDMESALAEGGVAAQQRATRLRGEELEILEEIRSVSEQRARLETRLATVQSRQVKDSAEQADLARAADELTKDLERNQEAVNDRIEEARRARMTEVQLLGDIDARLGEINDLERERLEVAAEIEDAAEREAAKKRIAREAEADRLELETEREQVNGRIRQRIRDEREERERIARIMDQIADAQAALEMAEARAARRRAEGDPMAFAEDRRAASLRAIEAENEAIEEQIRLARERVAVLARSDDPTDQLRRVQMEQQLVQLEEERVANQHEMIRLNRQIMTGLIDWMNQFGTVAEQITDVMTGTLDAAIRGIADGIEGLVNGTMTWREAWDQLVLTVVRAMVRMVAEFIAQQLVMFAVRRMFAAQEAAATASQASAAAVQWAPAATAASIASYGTAAAVGTAAFISGMASGTAAAAGMAAGSGGMGGFQEGGFTGFGSPDEVAGLVHRREFVVDAPATEALGVPFLENLQEMARNGGGFQGGGHTGGSRSAGRGAPMGQDIHIAEVRSRNDMREFMEKDGVRLVVDELERRGNRVSR